MNPYDQIRMFENAPIANSNRVQIWRCDKIPCDPETVIHKRKRRAVYFEAWTACDKHDVPANQAVWLWAKVNCPDCRIRQPRAKGRVSLAEVTA